MTATRMTATLVRMRLHAFWRSGRIVAPLLATILVLSLIFGGGASQPGDAYGLSAFILMPVIAWQVKVLLDTEPDVARRLALVTVGRRREVTAGLVAAAAVGIITIALAFLPPLLLGGVSLHPRPADPPFATGLVLGAWALLVAVPPGIALGAMASRAVTRSIGIGAMVLVGGWICVVVAGLPRSPVKWAAPPLIGVTRAARSDPHGWTVLGLTGWTLAWALAAGAAYVMIRRRRT
jgi:hypothetical protein